MHQQDEYVLTNIGRLHCVHSSPRLKGASLSDANALANAWLKVKKGRISAIGVGIPPDSESIVDAEGCEVIPGFIDCHTHMVYPASREDEYRMRLQGATYQQIAAGGGGILNSAKKMALADEEDLFQSALVRAWDAIKLGTAALEIKSGYGLSLSNELKMLRVIRRLRQELPIPVKATFLGAHAVPLDHKANQAEYVRMVCEEMLPEVARQGLADFADVFCELGYFSPSETLQILETAQRAGLQGKVHANQMGLSGGVETAIKAGATSADHLEHLSDDLITQLADSDVIGVMLPGCSFFLNLPYAPAREMISAGATLALASDFNPGTAPCSNLNLIFALAVTQMRMLPEEALNALTINAAAALGIESELGSFAVGKRASFIILKPRHSPLTIAYHFGHSSIGSVWMDGKRVD